MTHSPAEPRTHQAASPHPPAVSLTPQWTPNTAALLPYGASRQLVNTVVHLKTVTDGVICHNEISKVQESQKVVKFHIQVIMLR